MPDLDRFYREAAGEAAILAVVPSSSESGMRDLMKAQAYSFPVMVDRGAVGSAYKVRYVPDLFVIDGGGRLVNTIVGGTDFTKLNQLVDDLAGG
jgi:hypothetical protein